MSGTSKAWWFVSVVIERKTDTEMVKMSPSSFKLIWIQVISYKSIQHFSFFHWKKMISSFYMSAVNPLNRFLNAIIPIHIQKKLYHHPPEKGTLHSKSAHQPCTSSTLSTHRTPYIYILASNRGSSHPPPASSRTRHPHTHRHTESVYQGAREIGLHRTEA